MQTSKIFSIYKNCTFCSSRNLKKKITPRIKENFYTKAIISDLSIKKNKLKSLGVYECQKCYLIQVNPWFNKNITRKIYSNIYGQHNKSWSNYLSFVNNNKYPDHGKLYSFLTKNINIKKYGEFNSPFMGLFFNFFSDEYKKNNFYKNFSKKLIYYLSSRQLAGKSKKFRLKTEKESTKALKEIFSIKKKNFYDLKNKKYLFIDNTEMCWGQNDNYKSVNSKSLATEFFDLEILDIKKNKIKLDLFGFFLTLDHTFEPKKILDYALSNSKYVIVQCHTTKEITRQHQFSFTKKFLKFLKSIGIYNIDLTKIIEKNNSSDEIYFICSKSKTLIKNLETKINNP